MKSSTKHISEAQLLALVKHYLTFLKNTKQLTFKRITTQGIRCTTQGREFFAKNEMAGMADMLIFLRGGATLHVELKAPRGILSVLQTQWRQELKELGHNYYVVRELSELEKILSDHGIEVLEGHGKI